MPSVWSKSFAHIKKKEVPLEVNKWNTILDGEVLLMPATMFEAVGCEECKHSGYLGRLCVYELVRMTDQIKKSIHQKVEITELREKTRGLYTSIRVNGARKIAEKETTLDEIIKIVY